MSQQDIVKTLKSIHKLSGRMAKIVDGANIPDTTQLGILQTSVVKIEDFFKEQNKSFKTVKQVKYVTR